MGNRKWLEKDTDFFFLIWKTLACICLVEVEKRRVVCWSEHAEKAERRGT